MNGNIVETKLYPLTFPADYIVRDRLLSRLEHSLDKKLTLVIAPTGFGKTSLIAGWIQTLLAATAPDEQPIRTAWYTIDETDNNLNVFLEYLIAAIRYSGSAMLDDWSQPPYWPINAETPETIAGELLRSGADLNERLLIVLDDYHNIKERHIHRLISYLLRFLPRNHHVVLISRDKPPVGGLAALKARDQVVELNATDLVLTLAEAEAFFEASLGHRPDPEVVETIWRQTEGWAAGLRLAAITMSIDRNSHSLGWRLTEQIDREVDNYLVDEVLNRQPPDIRYFLLTTSLFRRFNPDLAAWVLDIEPRVSRTTIDLLIASHLFIIPLDGMGEWYRYHSQFQKMLENRLQLTQSADEIRILHSRAARWLEERDYIQEALAHFLAAGDSQAAAELVEQRYPAVLNAEEFWRLEQWLAVLPGEIVQWRPLLILAQAWVAYFKGEMANLLPLVDRADRLLGAGRSGVADTGAARGQITTLRSMATINEVGHPEEIDSILEALRLLPADYLWARGFAAFALALRANTFGRFDDARRLLENEIVAAAINDVNHPPVRLYIGLNTLHYFTGSINDLRQSAEVLIETARRNNAAGGIAAAEFALAVVAYEANDLDEALARLESILALQAQFQLQGLVLAGQLLLEIYLAKGWQDRGETALKIIRQQIEDSGEAILAYEIAALQAYWDVATGNYAAAARWASSLTEILPCISGFCAVHYLARVLLAQGRPQDVARAGELLAESLTKYETLQQKRYIITTLLLQAKAFHKMGDDAAALAAMTRALTIGFPLGYRRTYVNDELLLRLVRQIADVPEYASWVNELTGLFTHATAQEADQLFDLEIDSLLNRVSFSHRELAILKYIGEGLSNKEIAAHLYISPNTVRNHSSRIFAKLKVSDRHAAAQRARLLGLIP